jgi:hypothetical protein
LWAARRQGIRRDHTGLGHLRRGAGLQTAPETGDGRTWRPWAFLSCVLARTQFGAPGRFLCARGASCFRRNFVGSLLIRNYTDAPKKITLGAVLPAGWSQKPAPQTYALEPHDSYFLQLTVISSESAKNTWQKLTWVASSDGREIGTITLRGDVEGNGLPQ